MTASTDGVGEPLPGVVLGSHRALDADAWAQARGWAIWKALIVAAGFAGSHSPESEARKARRTIDAVLEDHRLSQ
ncbi:hypothetical protein ACI3KY_15975 [Microbacterium sp. ZW T2_14]|uniref:hypothetical protein n=1 Tax=Microbacterium sp. ZW T2_14 TaxID=3378079 RepID=UPI0038525B15